MKNQEVFELERSFEVSVQQEQQREGQKEEGWSMSELHFLLYSLKTGEKTNYKTC